jgi:hypothetical protein
VSGILESCRPSMKSKVPVCNWQQEINSIDTIDSVVDPDPVGSLPYGRIRIQKYFWCRFFSPRESGSRILFLGYKIIKLTFLV